ncbi:MAG: transposase [Mogibacterium sp.]|nr:transposase [Mogibacterium sp.]
MKKDRKKYDNQIAIELKESLKEAVAEMAKKPSGFIVDPVRDFTRRRKLDMETLINLILSMKGGSISKELYTYFGGDVETATSSAFVQQRAKIRAEAFDYLFRKFNDASSHLDTNNYDGYRLLAVDASDINIAKNPESDTYLVKSDYNQFQLNAVYDVLNKTYFDALVQPAPKEHEIRAAISMVVRSEFRDKAILIADRGYECFGLYEHIHRTDNLDYLIRVKNKGSTRHADVRLGHCCFI